MLKLPKGLKKKKKGKKSKKDQELFTEEELEQYKREHQHQQTQQQQQAKQSEDSDVPSDTETTKQPKAVPSKSEEDEEWSKFKALTAGVDSVVHKTQEDLDRIKSTSFFKRVLPPSEQKKLEEEEAAVRKLERLEQERLKKEEEEANRDKLAEAVVELSESEEESEEADDIFDTGYIDAITSGEVQLTVIPDSPVLEVEEGPDPFDTSYADKLIKGPEVSKRGKKLVSIGSAVEVLTGRVESTQASTLTKRKPRRGPQNLLLESFDNEDAVLVEGESAVTSIPSKSLLDDLADDVLDGPIDLSVPFQLPSEEETKKPELVEASELNEVLNVISEFDTLKENEDDEFAELAVESLAKKEEVVVLTEVVQSSEFTGQIESNWAEFEQQPEEDVTLSSKGTDNFKGKPPPPRPPAPTGLKSVEQAEIAQSDDEFDLPEDDPFDTTFVEKVLPGSEVDNDDDDFDFDPRAGETLPQKDLFDANNADLLTEGNSGNLLQVLHKDLLGGSTTDLSSLAQAPIDPVQDNIEEDEDFDPFDTSAISSLVKPKEAELKFLEKELLSDSNLKHSLSDPDFDPRADDSENTSAVQVTVNVPNSQLEFDPARRKSSLSLNLQSKSVVFLVPSNDLLTNENDGHKIQKPLTPYYPAKDTILEKEAEDPFDTSFVPATKPTQTEIKILEQDLITSTNLKRNLSDSDFDPRAEEANISTISTTTTEFKEDNKSDLLLVGEQINIKVLTPAQDTKSVEESIDSYVDPFDTSIAANILPGKTELKLLENELLPPGSPTTSVGVLDTLTDAQELGLGDKVLTPQIPISSELSLEEVDPFDTSFAENLGPGKTEIKLLETELIEN